MATTTTTTATATTKITTSLKLRGAKINVYKTLRYAYAHYLLTLSTSTHRDTKKTTFRCAPFSSSETPIFIVLIRCGPGIHPTCGPGVSCVSFKNVDQICCFSSLRTDRGLWDAWKCQPVQRGARLLLDGGEMAEPSICTSCWLIFSCLPWIHIRSTRGLHLFWLKLASTPWRLDCQNNWITTLLGKRPEFLPEIPARTPKVIPLKFM